MCNYNIVVTMHTPRNVCDVFPLKVLCYIIISLKSFLLIIYNLVAIKFCTNPDIAMRVFQYACNIVDIASEWKNPLRFEQ